nr:putative disease resistance protein At4g11170 [Ziziphus jujuba var. spinosa]
MACLHLSLECGYCHDVDEDVNVNYNDDTYIDGNEYGEIKKFGFDVHILGIWGMGGIGKTTLLLVLYIKDYHILNSKVAAFIWNVREEYARHGANHLRKKLLSELLNDEAILKMDSPFVASPCILDRLRHTKVLIVLDDVDSSNQLEALVEGYYRLAPGSRIIVTTRNMQVLRK